MLNKKPTFLERYWSRVDKTSSCWLWTGPVNRDGYGYHSGLAHRLAYRLEHGPIPSGLMVCHRCNVRLCVNPAHLYAGTALDNARDTVAARAARAESRRSVWLI